MTDSPHNPPEEGTDEGPDRENNAGTSRWVKASWLFGGLLVVALVLLHLTGHALGGHFAHGHHGHLPLHGG